MKRHGRVDGRWQRLVDASLRREQIDAEYWGIAKCDGGWRVELGFAVGRDDWLPLADKLFGSTGA